MKSLAILIADDNAEIRAVLQRCLTPAGHVVACVANGDEAKELLKTHRFDLLITDVLMPDCDGFELTMHAVKVHPSLRILVITGGGKYVRANDGMRIAKLLGAHAFLLKPFGQPEIFESINRALADSSPAATAARI